MNHPGSYHPPKCEPLFVVKLEYAIVCEDGTETGRTWTCGPTERTSIKRWEKQHPGVEIFFAETVAGNRRKKPVAYEILPRKSRRTGLHPNIAA